MGRFYDDLVERLYDFHDGLDLAALNAKEAVRTMQRVQREQANYRKPTGFEPPDKNELAAMITAASTRFLEGPRNSTPGSHRPSSRSPASNRPTSSNRSSTPVSSRNASPDFARNGNFAGLSAMGSKYSPSPQRPSSTTSPGGRRSSLEMTSGALRMLTQGRRRRRAVFRTDTDSGPEEQPAGFIGMEAHIGEVGESHRADLAGAHCMVSYFDVQSGRVAVTVDGEPLLVRPQRLNMDSRGAASLAAAYAERQASASFVASRHASDELCAKSEKLLRSALPYSASRRLEAEEPAPLSAPTKDAPPRQRLPWDLRVASA